MKLFLKNTYRKFIVKSTNEHGVHSPFVYQLLTLCFYKKRKSLNLYEGFLASFPTFFRAKHVAILNDVVEYLNVQKVHFFCAEKHKVKTLSAFKSKNVAALENADVVYIDDSNFIEEKIQRFFAGIKNDAFLIIENPYKKEKEWKNLKLHFDQKVIVDTYFFAFVFKRKQQASEEFFVRI